MELWKMVLVSMNYLKYFDLRYLRYLVFFGLIVFIFGCDNVGYEKGEASPSIVHFELMINTQNPAIPDSPITIEKDLGVLMLPESYTADGLPSKLVIYCHSGGGSVYSNYSEAESSNYCKYLCSLGYAVMDVAGMPETFAVRLNIDQGRTVGSYIAFRSYIKGYEFVINNYNIDKQGCYVLCNSNGGLNACNLVNLSEIPIIAQGGICPLLSTELNAWFITSKSFKPEGFSQFQNRANIIRIFGMENIRNQIELNNATYEKSMVNQFDPYNYMINETKKPYRVPFKIFQTKDDQSVYYDIAFKFATELNKRGSIVVLRSYEKGGHTSQPDSTLVGTYNYGGVSYCLTTTELELALWFKSNN